MKTRLYYTFVVGTAIALSNMRPTAQAQNQPTIAAVTDTSPRTPAQRGVTLLKPAADKLSAAQPAFPLQVPAPAVQSATSGFKSEPETRMATASESVLNAEMGKAAAGIEAAAPVVQAVESAVTPARPQLATARGQRRGGGQSAACRRRQPA